jgi:hypothetical protein
MTLRSRTLVLSIALALAVPPAAHALVFEKGIKVGANLADFRGEFADFAHTKSKLGFVGGPCVALRVAPDLAVQVEALFSMKGAKISNVRMDEQGIERGTFDTFFNVDYLEVPVLMRGSLLPSARVQPMFYIGPTLGFTLGGRVTTDAPNLGDYKLTDLKPVDVGVTFGGGVSARWGPRRLLADFRYTTGFTDIYRNDMRTSFPCTAESINSVFSLMVGVGF